jgi:triacylglycerol esterase/lipase EstA (alpha/beta hydrolase family)
VLDSSSPPRRRLLLALTGLVLLVVLAGGALVVRHALDEPAGVPQDEPGPALLVSGYGGSVRALEPLRRRLEAAGRHVVVVPPVGDNTGDLDAQAEALGRAADRAMARWHAASVDVVGYSAGGVVARLWADEHGGAAVARRVLTVGSPHHGAQVAVLAGFLGACDVACRELTPGSDLLRRLNAGDETPAGPEWISVWSTTDQVSTPPETARLAGALDLTVQSVCPGERTTHQDLPGDPVVLALLDSALGTGRPAVPEVHC